MEEKKKEVVKYEMDPLNTHMPLTLAGKFEMASLFVASEMLPVGFDTPQKVLIALQWGSELKLPPLVAIYSMNVIKGRPSFSTKAKMAMVRSHPQYAGITIVKDEASCTCTVKRKISDEVVEEYVNTFSIEDASVAGLLKKEVWLKYPKRMVQHRAVNYSLDDAFSDVLFGMSFSDDDYSNNDPIVTNATVTDVDDKKKLIEKPKDDKKKTTEKLTDKEKFIKKDPVKKVTDPVEPPKSKKGVDLNKYTQEDTQEHIDSQLKEQKDTISKVINKADKAGAISTEKADDLRTQVVRALNSDSLNRILSKVKLIRSAFKEYNDKCLTTDQYDQFRAEVLDPDIILDDERKEYLEEMIGTLSTRQEEI